VPANGKERFPCALGEHAKPERHVFVPGVLVQAIDPRGDFIQQRLIET
jgi:hypothetical protein